MHKFLKYFLVSILIITIIWMLFHFLYARTNLVQHNTELVEKSNLQNESNATIITLSSDSNIEIHSALPEIELLPVCTLKGQLVKHKAYELYYLDQAEEAAWVAYTLTEDHLNGAYERRNDFEEDPLVRNGSADNADYAHSGYDRGHLAPAADMSWSSQTMHESFYYSNMTPQDPSFNRGKWKELEEQVRSWAQEYHYVTVVTGPILSTNNYTIGHDHVKVPEQFYKIVYTTINGKRQALAFVMPNQALHDDLINYATNVDKVESITGINFFAGLPDSTENKLESTINITQWDFVKQNIPHHKTSNASSNKELRSTICKGITKAGNPCQNRTKNPNGYCQHHQNQAH